jgi:hypothetical protein
MIAEERSREGHESKRAVSESDQWRNFHEEFQTLADEELKKGAAQKDRFVRAYFTYRKGAEITRVQRDARWAFALFGGSDKLPTDQKVMNAGIVVHGPFCLIDSPECGLWILSEGINENLRERVQTLGARAGVVLGCPKATDPLDFWLHRLALDSRLNDSSLFFGEEKSQDGIILRFCEGSAIFCSRLERKALKATASSPEEEPRRDRRLKATISSHSAARRMEAYLESKGIGQTAFAVRVGTTDRTLRAFRKTGTVRRDIFESIATAMGVTKEALLKLE